MKKFMETMIFVLIVSALVSCGGDENVQCEDFNNLGQFEWACEDAEVMLCANEKKQTAWFEYEGEKYKCKGSGENIDCDKAFQEVYHACASTYCRNDSNGLCDYQVCTDENGGRWYEYNGKKYECEGTWEDIDCDRANSELTEDCENY